MKKKILGLDLGTTSIGFAKVVEDDNFENSSIELIGVRVNPLTTDEQTNFEKGRPIPVNADRTIKRGMRRNLDRYQLRRRNLTAVLKENKIITDETILAEDGKGTTHSTYHIRAKAVTEKIEKEELARVFFAINKKRGYKSSRKAKNEDEGQIIDGMAIARRLYEADCTPGQLAYQLLQEGKRQIPDFYRSDLLAEFNKVWTFQEQFHPEVLTDSFKKELEGKGQRATAASFWGKYQFNTAENKGTREEKKRQAYQWRSESISKQLTKEEVAYVITEINNDINNSSGYLGAISDRSKELYFNKETVGQYLYKQLLKNPHSSLTNQVFYRQDYLDEFEIIWNAQSKYHPELTSSLKNEIRDIIIFYQRKLKSQKNLISFCEFENREIVIEKNGQETRKTVGLKVIPKSSPLFQEFKIWQILHNIEFRNRKTKEKFLPDADAKKALFNELNLKGNLSAARAIEILGYKPLEWEINYRILEGNTTNNTLYEAYLKILDIEGYDVKEILKIRSSKDEIALSDLNTPAAAIRKMVGDIFDSLHINSQILDFDAELDGKAFEQQASYQLWHLLYSYEGDNSSTGNELLYHLLEKKFGFKKEHARVLANITLADDYGSLSAKAIRKIYPYIKELPYDKACLEAGYKHSAASLTKEEIATRPLKSRLELLKKNSLRNPVVEKILNQMVNVINTLIDTENTVLRAQGLPEDFHFDEIRIELARELKKNATERAEMTVNIDAAKRLHEQIFKKLQTEFGVKNPTRSDIIRYKLYEELKNNGYKDLYTNTYISREILFSKLIDIDHIIPQAKLFDDSFSNKTVVFRQDNIDKGNKTAFDYIESKYGEEAAEGFTERAKALFELGKKNKEEGISKAKFEKLKKKETEIGDGFIERDLRDSQYIAKKAKDMLYSITRSVISTTGSITDRLREDWGLVNIMQELNFEKFRQLGLTEMVEKKDGTFKERIIDWSKRNDHRHHAMDALTVAFTKHNHIQYLNYLNARRNESHKLHSNIIAIEAKETELFTDHDGVKKRLFREPIPHFRQTARAHLEAVIVSHKAKNKVVTRNKNKISGKGTPQETLTPRGQLHKETIYGKIKQPVIKEEKIGGRFNEETTERVTNPQIKQLLKQRLAENDNDPKKAFTGNNSLAKKPLFSGNDPNQPLPEKVTLLYYEDDYTIKKEITPENFKEVKNIEKVVDLKVRSILLDRLKAYNNDSKKAFSDLDKNPIWLNREKGIAIKRTKISGIKNAEALHYKKDHLGRLLLDGNGKAIPADFVSTGNNHHVAIYRDAEGNLQERVVSLFDAVQLVNAGEPVIDKNYNQGLGWQFLFTMKQNEYFVFPNDKTGFDPKEIDLLDPKNKKLISPNLFRVQKIATKNYLFTNHIETKSIDGDILKTKKALSGIMYHFIQTPFKLASLIKVRVNHIGDIVKSGEY